MIDENRSGAPENAGPLGEGTGGDAQGDALCGGISIEGKTWTFERRSFLDGEISFCVPAEFMPMPAEFVRLKYPSEHRPEIILSDESGKLGFCLNYTDNKTEEALLEALLESGADALGRMVPGVRILSKTLSLAGEKPIAVLEHTSVAVDTTIYNAMMYAELSGRLLIVTFNCVKESKRSWQAYALMMLESMRICEKTREEVL
jgi:hypothetical protein